MKETRSPVLGRKPSGGGFRRSQFGTRRPSTNALNGRFCFMGWCVRYIVLTIVGPIYLTHHKRRGGEGKTPFRALDHSERKTALIADLALADRGGLSPLPGRGSIPIFKG